MDCEQVYIGETGRTMQKRVTEHKTAVRKYDKNNGIAVHAWKADHRINWEAARVRARAPQYWKRRVAEALQIHKQSSRMNLDCGLDISSIWKPLLVAERSTSQLLPMYKWALRHFQLFSLSLCNHFSVPTDEDLWIETFRIMFHVSIMLILQNAQ